jgi:murein tripeptide amidase MpaA
VLDSNIQASIDAERKRLAMKDQEAGPVRKTPAERLADYFSDYHKYDEILQFCKDLATTYPDLVTFVPSIGKSVEGRDLFQIKISGKGDRAAKPRVWLHSLQHAREWISGATTQYIAHYLVSNYGKDARVTKLVDTIEWVITPVVNPDGYVYTWTTDRMWRKNKRQIPDGKGGMKLVGVDTNRNWPTNWGLDSGSSGDPADQTYRGAAPASEPEVQAMLKSFKATPNIAGSIDFHSYSEVILRPWGYADVLTPDEDKFVDLSKKLIQNIHATTKRASKYDARTKLYPVSGSVRDHFYSNDATAPGASKVYSLTVELSPNENFEGEGFILPPSEIVKVGAEWTSSIMIFAEYVTGNRLGKKSA